MDTEPAQSPDLPCLVPLTPEARRAAAALVVPLHRLPFRVGRDLRDADRKPRLLLRERRRGAASGPNDLYLPESGPRLRLSREHFLIGEEGGRYFLEDRRSALGTLVEGRSIGGARAGGQCELRAGDVIIPSGSGSQFVFKFTRRPPTFQSEAAPDPSVLCD
ncbi:MAG TPA: FHA domain-containing protein [Candidatus Methylomirabilis sp.]|nr:FHA domain-containing protein [Candidatus Methylomirabilis sp.]